MMSRWFFKYPLFVRVRGTMVPTYWGPWQNTIIVDQTHWIWPTMNQTLGLGLMRYQTHRVWSKMNQKDESDAGTMTDGGSDSRSGIRTDGGSDLQNMTEARWDTDTRTAFEGNKSATDVVFHNDHPLEVIVSAAIAVLYKDCPLVDCIGSATAVATLAVITWGTDEKIVCEQTSCSHIAYYQ